MNKKRIKQNCKEAIRNFAEDALPKRLKKPFLDNAFIAGGAIVSMLQNEDVNDYDIYISDLSVLNDVVKYFLRDTDCTIRYDSDNNEGVSIRLDAYGGIYVPKKGNVDLTYQLMIATDTALTFTDDIQLIVKFSGFTPVETYEHFDFHHTMVAYAYYDDELILSQQALESIIENKLYYERSKYCLSSLFRAKKYIERGWKCSAGELLKIAFDVSKLDLANESVLRDQLIGIDMIYFTEVIKILSKKSGEIDRSSIFEAIDEVFN